MATSSLRPLNSGLSIPDSWGQSRGQEGDSKKSWKAGSVASERPVLGVQGHLAVCSQRSVHPAPAFGSATPFPKPHHSTRAPGSSFSYSLPSPTFLTLPPASALQLQPWSFILISCQASSVSPCHAPAVSPAWTVSSPPEASRRGHKWWNGVGVGDEIRQRFKAEEVLELSCAVLRVMMR